MRIAFAVLLTPALAAQALRIDEVVAQAQQKYAAVRVTVEQLNAANAQINLARTAFLPKIDFLAQLNRATRNNVYGMLFPNTVIPPISGPPNPNNSMTNVWGSAAGFLVSWEPFDFGLRKAQVDAASASGRRAAITTERTKFEVASSAADAFVTILAAEQTTEAAKAGVDRAKVFLDIVNALVKAELRPGVESSRARAELAMAETQRIQAEQAVAVAKANLSQFLVMAPAEIRLEAGRLLSNPAVLETAAVASPIHPALSEQAAAIEESKARMKVLERTFYPKFNLQATQYARGTGARPDFTTGGASAGLGPNIYNWGAGFSMTIPIMDLPALRIKKQIESAQERVESARLDRIKQDLNSQLEKAKALLEGAKRIAANIPIQLEAARATETQATARYRAGLGTLIEVADAQRLLTQTEIDEKLSKLAIWRALLAVAASQGDLKPFLDEAVRK